MAPCRLPTKKASRGRAAYGTWGASLKAAAVYAATTLLKLILWATFLTVSDDSSGADARTFNPQQAGAAALARTHAKFKESCWKATYYSASELLALAVTVPEPWFLDTEKYWLGPGDQCWPDQLIKYKLKTLYMFMGGFYTYSIFALVFWETRRKDFGVSMAHHVASVLLIVFSYVARCAAASRAVLGPQRSSSKPQQAAHVTFARIGSVVVAIHDASDVWLELAKLSRYCQFDLGATTNFALFALSWLLLRLVYYPFWVIWSTTYEVLKVLNKEKHKYDGPVLYYTFNTLLIMLLVLHIYWWILIYRILVKQLFASGTVAKDDREDSEDED
eukprot:SM000030S11437  [mRNA]  locus=s30:633472:636225:- [translate_table: standard]